MKHWLYFIMASVGAFMFAFGNETGLSLPNESLLQRPLLMTWMIGGTFFLVGVMWMAYECETELIKRHKQKQS